MGIAMPGIRSSNPSIPAVTGSSPRFLVVITATGARVELADSSSPRVAAACVNLLLALSR